MSNLVITNVIESALIHGDLSKLTPEQRLNYNNQVCVSLGLNPLTKPFEYHNLSGKLVLYATKGCAEQLRSVHQISITKMVPQKIDDLIVVTVEAKNEKTGRTDSATGAVDVAGLKGEKLANAMMKAETKAKRRVTLSICGLNMLDETEVESIAAEKVIVNHAPQMEPPKTLQQVLNPNGPQVEPVSIDDYVIKFGKWKGQKIVDQDIYELNSYVDYIQKSAAKDNKEIKGYVAEFMELASGYLNAREASISNDDEMPF